MRKPRKRNAFIVFLLLAMLSGGTMIAGYINNKQLMAITCASPITFITSGSQGTSSYSESSCVTQNGHMHYFLVFIENITIHAYQAFTTPHQYSTTWPIADMILNDGLNVLIRESVGGGTGAPSRPAAASVIAIGTGTTAVSATQGNLVTELCNNGWTRQTASYSEPQSSSGTSQGSPATQFQLSATFTSTDPTTRAVTESSVSNTLTTAACSSNTTTGCTTPCTLARQTYSAINVANGDSTTQKWLFSSS